MQHARQLPADGRLAGTHRADEKQVLRMLHGYLARGPEKRKPTRRLAFTGLL
jgi:hypothetical protein